MRASTNYECSRPNKAFEQLSDWKRHRFFAMFSIHLALSTDDNDFDDDYRWRRVLPEEKKMKNKFVNDLSSCAVKQRQNHSAQNVTRVSRCLKHSYPVRFTLNARSHAHMTHTGITHSTQEASHSIYIQIETETFTHSLTMNSLISHTHSTFQFGRMGFLRILCNFHYIL